MARSTRKHKVPKRPKAKWSTYVGIGLAAILLLLVLLQGIMGLTGAWFPGGENYFGQPVDAMGQTIGAGVCLASIGLWALFRNRDGKRDERNRSKPKRSIPGEVPDRFPWE